MNLVSKNKKLGGNLSFDTSKRAFSELGIYTLGNTEIQEPKVHLRLIYERHWKT